MKGRSSLLRTSYVHAPFGLGKGRNMTPSCGYLVSELQVPQQQCFGILKKIIFSVQIKFRISGHFKSGLKAWFHLNQLISQTFYTRNVWCSCKTKPSHDFELVRLISNLEHNPTAHQQYFKS